VQSGQADKISTYLKDDMVGILAAINDVRDADK
jgi:hypothetical protein